MAKALQNPLSDFGLRTSDALFLFFGNADNLAALVMPAVRANGVRQPHLAAVAAGHQIAGGQRIVRPAPVTAALGGFSLGKRSHNCVLIRSFHKMACQRGRRSKIIQGRRGGVKEYHVLDKPSDA